ncbi:flagellar rod protein FlaI [Vibrio sp. 10N.286.49.B3]|nr:flagellar rod protein FlaI [Vibrio sp. 10N.286.49.B3]
MDELNQLRDLDHQLMTKLHQSEINSEEISVLVDTREQRLNSILSKLAQDPSLKSCPQWHEAVVRTKTLLELMESETQRAGQALVKYRHGNKSVQQYKKFL